MQDSINAPGHTELCATHAWWPVRHCQCRAHDWVCQQWKCQCWVWRDAMLFPQYIIIFVVLAETLMRRRINKLTGNLKQLKCTHNTKCIASNHQMQAYFPLEMMLRTKFRAVFEIYMSFVQNVNKLCQCCFILCYLPLIALR